MKKLCIGIMILALLFTAAACGGKDTTGKKDTSSANTQKTEAVNQNGTPVISADGTEGTIESDGSGEAGINTEIIVYGDNSEGETESGQSGGTGSSTETTPSGSNSEENGSTAQEGSGDNSEAMVLPEIPIE